MMVEAGRGRSRAVLWLSPAGDGDEGDLRSAVQRPDATRRLVAVKPRQADVEQDDARAPGPGELHRGRAIMCQARVVAVRAEQLAEGRRGVAIVVDEEDPPTGMRSV